jgi:hypothetical protein
MAIPALREAFQTNKLTAPAIDRARPLPELATVTGRIDELRVCAKYAVAGALLPDLLDELHWHAAQTGNEAAKRLALETLIEACISAGAIAKNLGYFDLAHVAALRAADAATVLDDPVQHGKAECLRFWTFPRERSWLRQLAVAEHAADALEPHARTSQGLSVLGMLSLNAALAAAVVQKPGVVAHWLNEAGQLSARLPDDMNGNWQSFCQTNVNVWRVAIGVERGESGGAVLEMARTVDRGKLTLRTREATYLADIGRGLARETKTRVEAVRWLRQAEDAAPQHTRNQAAVRETVAYLLGRATAAAGGRELRGMAARMGVPH